MKMKLGMSFAILIFLLAIIACGRNIDIFPPVNYDTGMTPVVAGVEKSNIIIEMHDSSSRDLYYHVGTADLDNNRVNWGSSQYMGAGLSPSVAVSEGGVVAEAHEEGDVNGDEGDGNIITTIGIASVNDDQISWGSGQKLGDTLYNPAICITRDGKTAVLIYEGNKEGTYTVHEVTLWYRVGNVDAVNKTVFWGAAVAYDQGIYASISINNLGHIITVHSSWQSNTSLWYKVGQLSADNTVSWGGTSSFNEGEIGAKVSIGDDPGNGTGSNLMLVYPGRLNDGALWLSVGDLPTGSTTADWVTSVCYGRSSQDVQPACTYAYNKTMVEVHDGSTLNWKLWYGFAQ
jgi:hypothetical protein